ncbi:ABC transporter ATP-binding protein [Roseibium aggregatum]|jgi:oligopeptide/dipeptide ABC transporter ATP-binding protein|uniref:ABC transporter ATP-binding protein n=1 Tax=Roseibium aggregatum TaxID=187304 RepID=UPI003A980118
MTTPAIEAIGLKKHFPVKNWRGAETFVRAVDGVSFHLAAGETLAIVGESGCGKSTVGRMLVRLTEPTSGQIRVDGASLSGASRDGLRDLRRKVQMVFQDPRASLNPRVPIGISIGEPMENFLAISPSEREHRVGNLLERVGLGRDVAKRYPSEFSGGQRQRIGIARALAVSPSVIIADEAVSALDVSVQAQVINLLKDLQAELELAYIFISHDLSVVHHIADRVAVMYLGRIVEMGTADEVFSCPRHPYTRALIESAPIEHPAQRHSRTLLTGEIPSPLKPPPGCAFNPRCPVAQSECSLIVPELNAEAGQHLAACHVANANLARGSE